MTVLLYRVDERLIHGQVVVGWGARLRIQRIVVVDDDLARSDWEQELYAVGVPAGIATDFVGVDAAAERLPAWQQSSDRLLLLTRDTDTMRRLAETGVLAGQQVNVGGIHHGPGREQVLRYVFLSDGERGDLRALAARGVRVSARDVPGAREVGLDELMEAP